MYHGTMNTMRLPLTLGLLLATSLAAADYGAVSTRGVDLSGHWKLNAALSDDAERLLQQRLDEERRRREKWLRRAREEGELFPPPDPDDEAGAPSSGAERAGPPPPQASSMRKRRDDELRKMLGISNTLDIAQSGSRIGIDSQVDARRFEAGTRSQVSMPQGELADSDVGWDGDWFVIERRARGGPRVVEKYRRLKKTDQLESVLAWSGETLLAGIKVRRIYDRVAGTVAPPDPGQGPVR
jgi:hypothetical protein